jgi:hypothetical protein
LSAVDLVADEAQFQSNVLKALFSEKDWLSGKALINVIAISDWTARPCAAKSVRKRHDTFYISAILPGSGEIASAAG